MLLAGKTLAFPFPSVDEAKKFKNLVASTKKYYEKAFEAMIGAPAEGDKTSIISVVSEPTESGSVTMTLSFGPKTNRNTTSYNFTVTDEGET